MIQTLLRLHLSTSSNDRSMPMGPLLHAPRTERTARPAVTGDVARGQIAGTEHAVRLRVLWQPDITFFSGVVRFRRHSMVYRWPDGVREGEVLTEIRWVATNRVRLWRCIRSATFWRLPRS